MADISASMVMELRQRTGLGMMECKKALTEAEGDIAKAEELLRIKSGAKATKAAGRVAAEGVIGLFVAPDAKAGAMVEVNCETDFVAKNDDFQAFANEIAQIVARDRPADVAALGDAHARVGRDRRGPARGAGAEDRREHHDPPLRAGRREGPHRVVRPWRRRSACWSTSPAATKPLGKDLAMHIAASKPMAVEPRPGAGGRRREGARDRRSAGGRSRASRQHRREDGRGRRRQVPRRGYVAGPTLRQGRRQADGRTS